jgi:kynurenine formamidase
MREYIDLSHAIDQYTISYKGLPAPVICDYMTREESRLRYEPGTSFQIGRIEMVGNTGTYIDCPFHRYEDGMDLADVMLERFVDLPCILVNAPFTTGIEIDIPCFEGKDLRGKAVLIRTDWSDHWMTDQYYHDHPYVTKRAAHYLLDQGVTLVGIDSHNIDDTRNNSRPVHSILLKHDILIVEHLCNLRLIYRENFLFSAVPPKIKGMGTFPVRAFASITKQTGS